MNSFYNSAEIWITELEKTLAVYLVLLHNIKYLSICPVKNYKHTSNCMLQSIMTLVVLIIGAIEMGSSV